MSSVHLPQSLRWCAVCDSHLVNDLRCCLYHSNVYYCRPCMDKRWIEKCSSCGAKRYSLCWKHECAMKKGHALCVDCWLRYDGTCKQCTEESAQ